LGGTGLEHPALTPPKTPISESRRTESGTVDAQNTAFGPDLQFIIDRWPHLSSDVRKAVVEIVIETQEEDPC